MGAILSTVYFVKPTEKNNEALAVLKNKISKRPTATTDHSKLDQLNRDFATPQEVTAACSGCHT